MKKERLTAANYHSTEMNNRYWSASLLKSFLECPARAFAELSGEYERPKSDALLVGSYATFNIWEPQRYHTYSEGSFEEEENEMSNLLRQLGL
jgi:hypothetical protein